MTAATTTARATLQNYHALTERQYKGDVDAIVALADLAVAVERAKLTARQAEALRLVYGADMTQAKAGEAMGIAQQTLDGYLKNAVAKIQTIYDVWKTQETHEMEAAQ